MLKWANWCRAVHRKEKPGRGFWFQMTSHLEYELICSFWKWDKGVECKRSKNINWRKVNFRTRWRLGEGMVLRGGTSYTAQVKVLQATHLVFSHTPKKGEPLQTGWAPQFVPVDFPQVLLSPSSHALGCHAPSAKMSAPLCPWSNVFLAHQAPSSISAPGATFVHLSWFYLEKFFLPFYLDF